MWEMSVFGALSYKCKDLELNEIVSRESGEKQGTGENLWNNKLVVNSRLIKCGQNCKSPGSINELNAIWRSFRCIDFTISSLVTEGQDIL